MKQYRLGLRGESHYQAAIRRCRNGMPVELVHEPTNKFDKRAICAKIPGGQIIGYAPKDSWVQRAIIDEDWTVKARISEITGGQKSAPSLGIVLDVIMLDDVDIENGVPVIFEQKQNSSVQKQGYNETQKNGGFFSGIISGFIAGLRSGK